MAEEEAVAIGEEAAQDDPTGNRGCLIAVLVLLAVTGLCVFGIVREVNSGERILSYPKVTAEIVRYENTSDAEGSSDGYDLTLEYIVDGKTYTARVHTRSNDRPRGVNPTVAIYYNPDDPSAVYLHEDAFSFSVVLLLAAFIVGCPAFGASGG